MLDILLWFGRIIKNGGDFDKKKKYFLTDKEYFIEETREENKKRKESNKIAKNIEEKAEELKIEALKVWKEPKTQREVVSLLYKHLNISENSYPEIYCVLIKFVILPLRMDNLVNRVGHLKVDGGNYFVPILQDIKYIPEGQELFMKKLNFLEF